MNEQVVIRRAQLTDLDDILSIFERTVQQMSKDDYSEEEIRAWIGTQDKVDDWTQKINNEYFLVAHIEDELVGFGGMKGDDQIDFIFTHHEYVNQGIASLVFDRMQSHAVEGGVQKLRSNVSKTGKHFFEQRGFTILREQLQSFGDMELVNFEMEKEI